jgi:hypothetical protein
MSALFPFLLIRRILLPSSQERKNIRQINTHDSLLVLSSPAAFGVDVLSYNHPHTQGIVEVFEVLCIFSSSNGHEK